jgi:hypothetical protein
MESAREEAGLADEVGRNEVRRIDKVVRLRVRLHDRPPEREPSFPYNLHHDRFTGQG